MSSKPAARTTTPVLSAEPRASPGAERSAATPRSALVAVSAGRFWRIRRGAPDELARVSPVPPRGKFARLLTARAADVAVFTNAGKAHVFRDGKSASTFEIDEDEYGLALSDDGSRLLVRSAVGEGSVRAFATCRDHFEVTGRFRIE